MFTATLLVSVVAFSLPMFASAAADTTLHTVPVDPSDIAQTVALGFNLVMIVSPVPSQPSAEVALLNSLPTGTKGLLVYSGGCTGAAQYFPTWANAFKNSPNLYGFYLYDEPQPAYCPAARLKEEADWVHANMPGIKTMVVLNEQADPANYIAYANGQDFIGLDPYPCVPWVINCGQSRYITTVVSGAIRAGLPVEKIVPVYQAAEWPGLTVLPSVDQLRLILSTWATLVPSPAFDYAYTWKHFGETKSLKDSRELQEVFRAYFASTSADTQAPNQATGP